MKKVYFLSFILAIAILVACNSTSTISSNSDELVNTNGIYIAFNSNVTSYRKMGDSAIPLRNIKVIRFLSQNKGIIIPESLTESESLDTNRIRIIYNWCLDYENKNPTDKDYIKIQQKFDGDTIQFSQKSSESETLYKGVNYKDSIRITYQTMHQGKLLPLRKELTFKFYKLY